MENKFFDPLKELEKRMARQEKTDQEVLAELEKIKDGIYARYAEKGDVLGYKEVMDDFAEKMERKYGEEVCGKCRLFHLLTGSGLPKDYVYDQFDLVDLDKREIEDFLRELEEKENEKRKNDSTPETV